MIMHDEQRQAAADLWTRAAVVCSNLHASRCSVYNSLQLDFCTLL